MPPNQKHWLQEETSFPELSYPSLRDGGIQTSEQWLEGKVLDDGAEGLWRIHDNLYDFSDFIKRHPGGESWLRMTKGTDITEAFESHHLSLHPENMLSGFLVRPATGKRHSPFTFESTGFYRTLKARVRSRAKDLAKGPDPRSKTVIEGLAIGMFVFSITAAYLSNGWSKAACCLLGGLFMTWTAVCAHNFTHQRDNWRMYLFNFNFNSVREWRVAHALSHHMFPNTLLDLEITVLEPFIMYLPRKNKTFINKYGPWVYFIIISIFVYDVMILKLFMKAIKYRTFSTFKMEDLVPLSLPTAMYFLTNSSFGNVLMTWTVIWHISSTIYNTIGLNAAHHHPDIFHDGDAPKEDRDWGIHQLNAVMDRVDINKSLFTVLTNYGSHGLHHLFPTLDHALLPSLYSIFYETCEEFHTELRMSTQFKLIVGQFRQIARTERKM